MSNAVVDAHYREDFEEFQCFFENYLFLVFIFGDTFMMSNKQSPLLIEQSTNLILREIAPNSNWLLIF